MSVVVTVFSALAGSGTTVYRGKVFPSGGPSAAAPAQGGDMYDVTTVFEKTNTGTGAIHLEVNNKPDQEYVRDVQAAAGADWTAKEAANTAGWTQRDLTPSATITVSAANPERHDVELDHFAYRRARWVYTNATGNVTLSGWVNVH
jgi:hypothetical protein